MSAAVLVILVAGGVVVLLADTFAGKRSGRWLVGPTVSFFLAALVAAALAFRAGGGGRVLGGMLVFDRFGLAASAVFLVAGALTALAAGDFLAEHDTLEGEVFALLLFAVAGMCGVAFAGDLVSFFVSLEALSLAVYVLAGCFRRSKRSAEAALKYFLAGAFSSAILVYGIALVYGATGETSLVGIADRYADHQAPMFLFGEYLILVALAFKMAAVPFHMWAPDAYEGAPTPFAGFLAAGVKAAAVTGALRILLVAFGGSILPYGRMGWGAILGALALLTMTVGNVAALRQSSIKRMLAYSSIAHAGYLLVGVVAAGVARAPIVAAVPAILYYLLVYVFSTVGAFAVVAWVGRRGAERLDLDEWEGLASRRPAVALAMTLFLLSLGGIPPLGGFFAKLYVFRAALTVGDPALLALVVAGVLNSLISMGYYLRVVTAMYLRDPRGDQPHLHSVALAVTVGVAVFFVVEMGILPGSWMTLAGLATLP